MLLHLLAAKRGIWTPILRWLEVYFNTFSFFFKYLMLLLFANLCPNIKELDMTENVLHFSVLRCYHHLHRHVSAVYRIFAS